MPVALISTRTSPARGPSRSTSTISSGFFTSNATAARVFMAAEITSFSLDHHEGELKRGAGFTGRFELPLRDHGRHAGLHGFVERIDHVGGWQEDVPGVADDELD